MSNCGFVLSDDMQLSRGIIRHYVLVIKDYNNVNASDILPIHESAFRIGHEEKELDVATRKNLQRRLGRPLLFGDVIEWRDHQVNNNMIMNFTKVSKLFETRHINGKSQVLMEGVLSPEDSNRFWTVYFPHLLIKSNISCLMIPNVLVLAWINISVDNDGRMFVDFDSFNRVPSEGQDKVASAPWNVDVDKYSMVKLVNDVGTWDDMIVKSPNYRPKKSQWQREIFQRTGLLTSSRTLFCKDFPCYEFIIPLIIEMDGQPALEIGAYYKFHAFWNDYEKIYMVNDYTLKKDAVKHPLCPKGLLRVTVKAWDGYPGIYKNEQYGLLDDPKGVLALYHLSKYANSSVVVSVKDGGAIVTCPFRFRIMEVLPDKAQKLSKWIDEEKITVNNSKGIIIDDFVVFSKDHPELLFRFLKGFNGHPCPGSLIQFEAVYDRSSKDFLITQYKVIMNETIDRPVPFIKKRMLLCAPNEFQNIFYVKAKPARDFPQMLESEYFGLLDTRQILQVNSRREKIEEYNVWIMMSRCDITDDLRPSRTSFCLVSEGAVEPVDKIDISCYDYLFPEYKDDNIELPTKSMDVSASRKQNSVHTSAPTVSTSYCTPCEVSFDMNGVSEQDIFSPLKAVFEAKHHSNCTNGKCVPNCEQMELISKLMVEMPDFVTICSKHYPKLYAKIANYLFA